MYFNHNNKIKVWDESNGYILTWNNHKIVKR